MCFHFFNKGFLRRVNYFTSYFLPQVKAQYNILMDSMKHTSVQHLLDSHLETLSGQMRSHQTQQAMSLHKVDMEASVVEVSCRLGEESNFRKKEV